MTKKKPANGFDVKNLIVLTYGPNNCYMGVIEAEKALAKDKNLHIDLQKGTWHYGHFMEMDIGCGYQASRNKSELPFLGIYDKTEMNHLNSLAHAASAAVHSSYPSYDD